MKLNNKALIAAFQFIAMIAFFSCSAFAGTLNISNYPISSSTNVNVKPNLMYILDDSGSMSSIFAPEDYPGLRQAAANRSNVYADPTSSFVGYYKDRDLAENHDYNTMWYTPDIRYDPPAFFYPDGTENTTKYPIQDGSSLNRAGLPTENRRNWKAFNQDLFGSGSSPICAMTSGNIYNPTIYNNSYYCNLENMAGYWNVRASEYCVDKQLKTCTTSSTPTGSYIYPAPVRWCGWGNSNCRIDKGEFNYNRLMARPSGFSIRLDTTSETSTLNSIAINGKNILKDSASFSPDELRSFSSASTLDAKKLFAKKIVTKINDCTYNKVGNCTQSGQYASLGTVTTRYSDPIYIYIYMPSRSQNGVTPQLTYSGLTISSTIINDSSETSSGYSGKFVGDVVFVPISRDNNTYVRSTGGATKHPNRTDCAGDTCTYEEEMTNFANWAAYHSSRISVIKTHTSQAFKQVDDKVRIGFVPISFKTGSSNYLNDVSRYLPIKDFTPTNKYNWYNKLFSMLPTSVTPLRASLSLVGKLYAGQNAYGINNNIDPVQHSCQANYALLTTDGYYTDSTTDFSGLNGERIGDLDGGRTARPKYDPNNNSGTLADVAKYFYDTDLRDASTSPYCKSADGMDLCSDNVPTSINDQNNKQHMVTFTLGLGVNGFVGYSPTYQTDADGDFADIAAGRYNWPNISDFPTRIDDLWHAAVNSNGKYFSASEPDRIRKSISELVTTITSRSASGSASATSSLRPVPGDNSVFVASYQTGVWTGNVEARTVDTTNGSVSRSASWCAESIVDSGSCSNGQVFTTTTGGSKQFYCASPSTRSSCTRSRGVFDSASATCTKQIPTGCTGTMKSLVSSNSDTRNILMKDVKNNTNSLVQFNWSNLSDSQKEYFSKTRVSSILTQLPQLSPSQVEIAQNENLVNYLRGQTQYEMNPENGNKLFRSRISTLGDIVDSTPIYVGAPTFNYGDAGYPAFKESKKSRTGVLFVGSNDGMLHAFNGKTGQEIWAYIPSEVVGNLAYLADSNYGTNHKWFVNGDAVISDVCMSGCNDALSAVWKTILVGGLRGGGSMYYALDITDTTNPKLLWEFSKANDSDLGLTYGSPVITKGASGTWSVLLTAGHNNVSGTNPGKGVLYVVNPQSGAIIHKLVTSAGSADNPSGMVDVSAYARSSEVNNQTVYAYSGDLLGNVWKFNIDADQSSSNPQKVTTLTDANGLAQPITSKFEIGMINDFPIILVGTGRIIEATDVENKSTQSFYAMLDNGSPIQSPRSSLVKKTLTTSGDIRTVSDETVDYNAKRGWYVDLPDNGERSTGKAVLSSGVVVFPSVVPSPTYCTPGGYSYLNYFNYKDGRSIDSSTKAASMKTESPVVGINLMYINNSPSISYVTTDDPTPERATAIRYGGTMSGFQSKRTMWREMTVE